MKIHVHVHLHGGPGTRCVPPFHPTLQIQAHYGMLCVFPEDVPVHVEVLAALWGKSREGALEVARGLVDRSLVFRAGGEGTGPLQYVMLHDLQRDGLRMKYVRIGWGASSFPCR